MQVIYYVSELKCVLLSSLLLLWAGKSEASPYFLKTGMKGEIPDRKAEPPTTK